MSVAIVALLVVLGFAGLIALLLIRGKSQDKPVKVMMFVGYFWLSAFLQLLLLAGIYYAWQHY